MTVLYGSLARGLARLTALPSPPLPTPDDPTIPPEGGARTHEPATARPG